MATLANRQPDEVLTQGLLTVVFVAVGLTLLTPLVVTFSTIFPFIVGKAVYSHVLIEVAFGAWILLAWKRPEYRLPGSRIVQALALYLAVALLAGLFGVSFLRSMWSTYERMQGIVDLAHWLAFAVVLVSTLRTTGNWRTLLNVNLGVSLFLSLLGVGKLVGIQVPPFNFFEQNARLELTLGNATYVGAYMLVNFLIALGFLAQSLVQGRHRAEQSVRPVPRGRAARRRRAERRAAERDFGLSTWGWRVFWVATASSNLWVMIYSGTRGVVVDGAAALLALCVCYVFIGKLRQLRIAAAVVVGLMVLGGVAFFAVRSTPAFEPIAQSNVMLKRLASAGADDKSIQGRIHSVAAGLRAFAARPILGWGPENYHVAFGRYVSQTNPSLEKFDQAHSKPVEELATKGALGFLSYMAIWVLMFWVVLKRARRENAGDQAFTLTIGACLVGYFVQNLFLFDTATMLLQFVMLAAFVASIETTAGAPTRSPAEGETRISVFRRLLSRFDSVPALQPDARFLYGSIAVVALVVAAILFVNIRVLVASQSYRDVRIASVELEERIDGLAESADMFPGLGNYPRRDLFDFVARELARLPPERVDGVVRATEREAEEALDVEPENWHLVVALGLAYQTAVSQDQRYLALARAFTDQATELAPGRWEVFQLRARQLSIEGDPGAGADLLNELFEANPEPERVLGWLRDQLVSASQQ